MNTQETQQATYERLLAKAHDDRLFIKSSGTSEGDRIWWVVNPANEPDTWYTVRWARGARVLACNCEAGRRAIPCKHRALVREALLTARASEPTPELTPRDAGVSDGLYTVVFADGERRTLRITTQPADASFAPGERLVAYLAGADNDHDYVRFAFFTGGRVKVWKRFAQDSTLAQAARVLEHPDDAAAAGLAYALESGRCYRCNRTLTVPASINRGLGPDCAALVGVA